jgi:4,5-DOPA dioxygenase extradiol
MTTGVLKNMMSNLPGQGNRMPVLFIGHGSPMNAIEENVFTKGWKRIAGSIPRPRAILFISAHWLTRGTWVTAMKKPKTIHDFAGFPSELFAVNYPADGDPDLAREISSSVTRAQVGLDEGEWGLDHGSWSVARPMFPDASIPAIQMSIDYHKPALYHYELAKELAGFRNKGVLIIGSGNIVHNLGYVDYGNPDGGFDWAVEMNEEFKKLIREGDHYALIDYERLGKNSRLAVPTPDHYFPLMYSLGLQDKDEPLEIFNDRAVFGSVAMTSVKIGN